jgi:phage shock protein PspC (stress-responsive transcriptional regulator)
MSESTSPKRLVRIQKDRKLAGVCTGFGAYCNLDPVLFRILFIALILAGGCGLLFYLICWIVMPLQADA